MVTDKKHLCMVFDDLALYRKAIYKMIDREYDCDWYIEEKDTGVRVFDASELKRVKRLKTINIGPFFRIKGLFTLLRKDYEVYFMLGATRNLSLLPFCILKKLFYPKKRVYLWTHGFYGKESRIEWFLWKKPMLKMADGLFTYGDYAKKLLVEKGFDERKIFPIHNSLDYDIQLDYRKQLKVSHIYTTYFENDKPVIIFIGRLTPVKRLDMLVDAISLLKNKGEIVNIVFIGDGSEKSKLVEMVTSCQLQKQVWFYGECFDEKKNAELVFNADLCVAPGNIGLTVIHSLMFGCPAISHNNFSWQMPEFEAIRPDITGEFYEYGSVESLANTISKWLESNGDKREEVRNNCYHEIDNYWNPYYQISVIKNNLK